MASRRVLFLGPTGVNKADAIKRVKMCAEELDRTCRSVDFEKDYLQSQSTLDQFLDQTVKIQYQIWRAAWSSFRAENGHVMADAYEGPDVFLSLHGCFTRGFYGTRLVADPAAVAEFRPHLIVTLIDDIYDLWWRTEVRAEGQSWRGRPTLEQLALARRVEAAFGDLVACLSQDQPRHLLVAAAHPHRTVSHAIYGASRKVVYLSFPISEPRRLKAEGEVWRGVGAVDGFLKRAAEAERANLNVSCICPLGIDEIPFVRHGLAEENQLEHVLDRGGGREKSTKAFCFPREDVRWDLSAFWDPTESMRVPPTTGLPFLCDQLEDAAGNLGSDVSWRDYRLVGQADELFVFNPVMNGPGRKARGEDPLAHGVAAEIYHALGLNIIVHVYQDEAHDPDGEFGRMHDLIKGGVVMGQGGGASRLIWHKNMDEMFDTLR